MVDLSAHASCGRYSRTAAATVCAWTFATAQATGARQDDSGHPAELEPVDCWAVVNARFGIFVEEADQR
uniref:hypothetical protein n=1 Tax=Burkholderia anthina TaxID=179879 RepID=UPI001FC837CE|nr:hypothetical protein [Burkholderia anthina]